MHQDGTRCSHNSLVNTPPINHLFNIFECLCHCHSDILCSFKENICMSEGRFVWSFNMDEGHTILNLFLVLSFKHFKYNCDYEMYFRNSLKFSKGVIIKPKQPYTIYQMPTL